MQATAGLQKHLYNPRIQPDTEHTGHASAAIGTARFAHRLASSKIFLMRSEPEVSASRRAFSCLLHCCISDFMSLRAFSYSSFHSVKAFWASSLVSKTPSKYFMPKAPMASDL